eukprot:4387888-Amphidinium_carterae.1
MLTWLEAPPASATEVLHTLHTPHGYASAVTNVPTCNRAISLKLEAASQETTSLLEEKLVWALESFFLGIYSRSSQYLL